MKFIYGYSRLIIAERENSDNKFVAFLLTTLFFGF